MIVSLNPAGRLHAILLDALRQPETDSVETIWRKVFGLPDGRSDLVLVALSRLVELTHEIEREVRMLEGEGADYYLKSMQRVRDILAHPHLGQQWKQLKPRLDKDITTRLELCSYLLSKGRESKPIPKETLESLQSQVQELQESIAESNISLDLKVVLLRMLDEIRNAILTYRIVGADGLRDALTNSFGTLSFYWSPIKSEASESQVQKLGSLIRDLNAAVSLALNVPRLTEGASKVLELLQG